MDMQIEEQIRELLKQGELLKVEQLLTQLKNHNADMVILDCLIQIFHREVEKEEIHTIFDYSVDLEELVEHFIKTKLYMRRLEFELPLDKQKEACQYWLDTKVSKEELYWILSTNIFYQKKVCNCLVELFAEMCGKQSAYAQYFEKVRRKRWGENYGK